VLEWKSAETPDKAHVTVCSKFTSSATTLNIESTAVPRTMIVTLLTVLRLSLRTVRHGPLRCQISRSDRQKPRQPKHGPAAGQCLREVLSCLRQHDRVDRAFPARDLRGSTKQLERFGHAEDVADLLFQVAVEVPMDWNLRDEIDRREVEHVEHNPR
jgi:hypothetical protein